MYTPDHIFPVPPIKDLINKDSKPTIQFKLATGTKPSVSHSRVLFFTCVVRKATTHVVKKGLNMRHQAQTIFCGVFVGFTQHQKGYLVCITSIRKIISSYDVVFDNSIFSMLAYMSQPYAEAMAMRRAVSYILCATYSKEQTSDIITFTQFE